MNKVAVVGKSVVPSTGPEGVADRLEAIAKDIETTTAVAVYRIGERLAEAQDLFKYARDEGGFGGWVAGRLKWDRRQADRLISVYRNIGPEKLGQLTQLSTSALVALAAPSVPAEVRDQVDALLVDGQKVTVADIKRLKAEAQTRNAAGMAAGHRMFCAPQQRPGMASHYCGHPKPAGHEARQRSPEATECGFVPREA